MIRYRIIFKDYDLANPMINGIKTKYNVFSHSTRIVDNRLQLTFEIEEEYFDEHLELIESLGLETD